MKMGVSRATRFELIRVVKRRYMMAAKAEKTSILNEFVATTGYHRKHAIRLMRASNFISSAKTTGFGKRIYDDATKEALTVVWEASDRICGKRLKQIIPDLVDAMERHGHLSLDLEVRKRLFRISAATIDRLLSPVRAKTRRKKPTQKRVRKQIPIRTFADWDDPCAGFLEIDFVVHGGGSMAGSVIHTLVATDVCSGWTESVPLLAREQSLVVEGLEVLRRQFPVPILGIDSDNDGAFINETLVTYCKTNHIEFTRSRAYRKNDQAWIEQKNGSIIRRHVGHARYSGVVAGQALARLYQSVRLVTNYFQPSFKLRGKTRVGSKIKKIYHKPATPCQRLMNDLRVKPENKNRLRSLQERLDPMELLFKIRESQAALAALSNTECDPGQRTLQAFLAELPNMWRLAEVRPTHQTKRAEQRWWRTRKDPFQEVWPQVLQSLQETPDITAKELFKRLQKENPGRYPNGQLRTLQRRVREWRGLMAKHQVYVCLNESDGMPCSVPVIAVGPTTC